MRFLQKLQPLMVAVAIFFIVLLLGSQWDELRAHEWQLHPAWLAASAGFLVAAWALEIAIWRQMLTAVGGVLPYWPAVRIWFLSAIVRYIPGNIWQPLSMTLLCQRYGVAPEATILSIALYQVVILLAVAPIAAVYFAGTGNWGLFTDVLGAWTPWLIAVGLSPVLIVLVQPRWLIDAVNWALVKVGRPALRAGLSRRALLTLLVLAMGDWLLWGAAFAALAFGIDTFSPQEMVALAPHLIAVYSVAYAIGFISLITPSGLGVREGAFYVLLAPLLGGGTITVLALAMRLWTTLGELIGAGISALFHNQQPAPALTGDVPAKADLTEGLT
jgi:uncharacterized membrane protein YbhN (UPF0104 family)